MTALRPLPLLLLALCLWLAGCAQSLPLPGKTPVLDAARLYQVHTRQGRETDYSLLAGAALRFAQFDPLGVPLARQRWADGSWHADGLLPPNPAARELFAVLLFALSPAAELPQVYPGDGWRLQPDGSRQLGTWQVRYPERDTLELDSAQGLSYHLWRQPDFDL